MSYLKFDKDLIISLEYSLYRNVLRTNRRGAYQNTSISGCNTTKYQGLLVMPVPNLDDDNHLLLSSFDETVIQHGAEFNLGIHKYSGGISGFIVAILFHKHGPQKPVKVWIDEDGDDDIDEFLDAILDQRRV